MTDPIPRGSIPPDLPALSQLGAISPDQPGTSHAAAATQRPSFRYLAVFTVVAFILMLGLLVMARLRSWDEAERAGALVEHTLGVMVGSGHLLASIQYAEAGQRGYLLTLDADYLRVFETGRDAAADHLLALRQLTSDNSAQQDRLAALQTAVGAKTVELDHGIDMARGGNPAAALADVRTGNGRQLMQDVRRLVREVDAEEERLLSVRRQQAAMTAQQVTLVLDLAAVAALISMLGGTVAMMVLVRRQRQRELSMLENSSDDVIVFSSSWRVAFLNRNAAKRMAGDRALHGADMRNAFPGTEGGPLRTAYRHCMAARVPIEAEEFCVPLGRYYLTRAFPSDGGGITVFLRDVTEQRAAAAQLAESDARQRALLATLDLGAFMARNLDGCILHWSLGCERLYGWSAGEALGRMSHDLLSTSFPLPFAEIQAALERDGEWVGDLRQRTREGRPLVVSARKVLRRGVDGHSGSVLESLSDVTTQRQAEAALAESEARLRSVVDTAADGILVVDEAHRIVDANPAAVRMFGFGDAGEMAGHDLDALLPRDSKARLGKPLAEHGGTAAGDAASGRATGALGARPGNCIPA